MFIAALFTIGKIWKQPVSPSVDEWIKINCGRFIQWYDIHQKIKGIPTFGNSMDGTGNYYAK